MQDQMPSAKHLLFFVFWILLGEREAIFNLKIRKHTCLDQRISFSKEVFTAVTLILAVYLENIG